MGFFKSLFGGKRRSGGGGGGTYAFDPGPNPASMAMPYLDQIPGTVKPYLDPYVQEGRTAGEALNPIYGRMSQDPTAFLNELMGKYTPSTGYKFKENEMLRAAQNSAAQGGYAGTRNAQMEQSDLVRGLLGQDMQEFLTNLLGIQGRGIAGQEQRVGRGFDASTDLANILGSNLGQKATLGFQGQAQQNQNRADAFANQLAAKNARRNSRLGFLSNLIGAGTAFATGGFGR